MNDKLKKILDADPPVEPTPERPGAFVQSLLIAIEKFKLKLSRDPTAEELVVMFAHILDYNNHLEEKAAYDSLRAAHQRFLPKDG